MKNIARSFAALNIWVKVGLAAALVGAGIGGYMSLPQHGTWRYGACKVFLERYVRFPDTIKVVKGEEFESMVRLSFSDINPFGTQQLRDFECHFSTVSGQLTLSRLTMDRKALPDDIVKEFSYMLPLLAVEETDTTLPRDLPSDLEDLKQ